MMLGSRNVKQIACPLCNEEQDTIINGHYPIPEKQEIAFDKENGFAFCNCRDIFFGDWKNIEQAVYDSKYTDKYQGEVTNKYFRQYFATYYPIIKPLKSSGKFLEIGCVNKTLLDCFKTAGFDTYSLDIIEHSWEGHNNITADFEKYRTNDKFAVVWASHVFEHFKRPVEAFTSVFEVLENGGVCFIAMPDPYFIDWNQPYSWGHWHLREHHIMWNMDSLCAQLEELGFEIVQAIHNIGSEFVCNGDMHLIIRKP